MSVGTPHYGFDWSDCRVTAIVMNYYSNRRKYSSEIHTGLERNPEIRATVVWDNCRYGGVLEPERSFYGFGLIRSRQLNLLLGRYAAAFLSRTPYVFVQDNDLVIEPGTVDRLLRVAREYPKKIIGAVGIDLDRDSKTPYSDRKTVIEGPSDIALGRLWLCHRSALVPGFRMILEDGVYPGRADDILFSMAGDGGYAVPCEYENLDEQGVGLTYEPGHFEERDAFALFMMENARGRFQEKEAEERI